MERTRSKAGERGQANRWSRASVIGVAGSLLAMGLVLAGGLGIAAHRGGALGFAVHGHGDHSERVAFAVDWLMYRVDASESQRQLVHEIVAVAGERIHELVKGHAETHDAFIEWLGQATLDREVLEGYRGSEMDRADAISLEVTRALADLAEVLTPEQRLALIDEVQRFHSRHR